MRRISSHCRCTPRITFGIDENCELNSLLVLRLTIELHAEGDVGQQQPHRAAPLDHYALNRPQLRRADALRNVRMDASAQSNSAATTTAAREPADPVSGGITLTGGTLSQDDLLS